MQRLAIVGAGDLGLQIHHYAELTGNYEVIGFFDDYSEITMFSNKPILGKIPEIYNEYRKNIFDCLFIAVGYKHLSFKSELYQRFKGRIPFATIISVPSYIDNSAKIGEGVIIYPGVVIDKNVVIEDNVLVNLGAIIAHDSHIGEGSFIGPRTTIAGCCEIGKNNFLGINSTLIDHVITCDDVSIGASSLVLKSITEVGVYIGCPCKNSIV